MLRLTHAALVGCAAAIAPSASATVNVIFSEIVGDPTSLVPAGAGVPAGTIFQAFDRPYRSSNGLAWIISADTDLATTEDEIIIVLLGPGGAPVTVVREGTIFGSSNGELVGLIDRNLGIANTGQYVFATNTNGPTTADEVIVRWDGIGWIDAAREGDPVPGFPGEVLGITLDSSSILDDGVTVGYRAPSTVGALGTDFDDFLILLPGVIAQEGVTIPGNQALGAMEAWDNFSTDDFYVSGDGLTYQAAGDLTGATTGDNVVVVNGDVVIQEDSVVPGSSFPTPVETIVESLMSPTGDWFARGDNDDQEDWAVASGNVVGVSGEPIVFGSEELFDDTVFTATFFWMGGDGVGDYVIGGTTSNPDVEADAVLVLNGTTVLARQGDPVDLNGNGLPDDDVFIDVFNNDDGFLTSAGLLYFTADLQDGLGASLGQGFLVLDTNTVLPCPGDITPVPADGVVDVVDFLFLLAHWGPCGSCETSCPGDINGDCTVDVVDFLQLLANWGPCP